MKIKRIVMLIVTLLMLFTFVCAADPQEIRAEHAIVVNPETDTIVYEKDAHGRAYPASMTKMMTALIAITEGDLDKTVEVTSEAFYRLAEMGSGANFKAGEKYKMRDLLYYLLVSSGNDAANVIALDIAGSLDAFVTKMNAKAAELGMNDTHFANAHGLHDENHYTTAYDMYLLAKECKKLDLFNEITQTDRIVIEGKTLLNTNNLISKYKTPDYYYQYANGIKTGFTTPAGHCLASSATKKDTTYYCVVMGCPTDEEKKVHSFVASKDLFEWAFDNFSEKTVVTKGQPVQEIRIALSSQKDYLVLVTGDDLSALMSNDYDPEKLEYTFDVPDDLQAPVDQKTHIGTMSVSYEGRDLGTVELLAMNSVQVSPLLYVVNKVKSLIFHPYTKKILIGLAALIVLIILISIVSSRIRRRHDRRGRRQY